MSFKTEDGVTVVARQRANATEVEVRGVSVHSYWGGRLTVGCSIGKERGVNVSVSIGLEEILAWLPSLVEQAKKQAVRDAPLDE